MTAELLLVGPVRTGDAARPRAGAVAFAGGRVLAVGEEAGLRALRGPRTEVVEVRAGAWVVPGFVDAHLHFRALARRAADVDGSADACPSIPALLGCLREAAARTTPGGWIRAFGWDAALLAERRPPTLDELDAAAPDHPLRLLHRTGQAALLNRAAIAALGLERDPKLERDAAGRPTGLLHEPGEVLRGRVPGPDGEALDRLCADASLRLLAAGVVAFHDPTPGQGPRELGFLQALSRRGLLRQRVQLYGGADLVRESRPGADPGARVRIRGRKVVVPADPDPEAVAGEVAEADRAGWSVAIHAVEEGPLAVAVAALARLEPGTVRRRRHRIEHASLCAPPLAARLGALGATVVTHPDFLARFGEKYRAGIPGEQEAWLYPLRRFLDDGVAVAFGSDAPIAPPAPLAAIGSAVVRRGGDGRRFAAEQALAPLEALALHTVEAAAAAGDDGALRPGAPGDAVVLGADPAGVPPEEIASIPVEATIVAGEVAWAR